MKILHVAAHMGGGIGAAYVGLGTCGQEQAILLLEPPQDLEALSKVASAGFRILNNPERSVAEQALRDADAVVFSWHHHPVLTRFLRDFPEIMVRSILWCHISGNYYPSIPADFVKNFHKCMFTSPYSLELPQIQALGSDYARQHFQVVYGLNDLSRYSNIRREPHDDFRVGYVGTLGFCKLHPEFVDFCAKVNLPQARFVMVGSPSTKSEILSASQTLGMDSQFTFCGQLADVRPALAQMDVFSYLLNPQHFGTTENALLEAMAAGIPVVALNQCVERGIIHHGRTGLLVNSPEEYGRAIRYLYRHPEKASRLGENAKVDVMKRFSLQENRKRFLSACEEAVKMPKRIQRFSQFFIGEPADWFLSCVEDDRDYFRKNCPEKSGRIFHERAKSSPLHYHVYFPEDPRLLMWSEKIRQADLH